jgi:hypothetical protein
MTQENQLNGTESAEAAELRHARELISKAEDVIQRLRASSDVATEELGSVTSKLLDLRVEHRLLKSKLDATLFDKEAFKQKCDKLETTVKNLEAELVKRSTQLLRASKRNQESLELFSKCAVLFASYVSSSKLPVYVLTRLKEINFPKPNTIRRVVGLPAEACAVEAVKVVFDPFKSINKTPPTFTNSDMPMDYFLNAFYHTVSPIVIEDAEVAAGEEAS